VLVFKIENRLILLLFIIKKLYKFKMGIYSIEVINFFPNLIIYKQPKFLVSVYKRFYNFHSLSDIAHISVHF